MLNEFEQKLYALAAEQGYPSMDTNNDFLCRHAIERFLIDKAWKNELRIKNADAFFKPLLPDDADPDASVFHTLKAKLDPEHYNLGDERVNELFTYLKAEDTARLQQALRDNPALINRRNVELRTLIHEALCLENAEASITLLLNHGASLAVTTASHINAPTLALQIDKLDYFRLLKPTLYQQASQFDTMSSILVGSTNPTTEKALLELLHETSDFRKPCNDEEKSDLLHLAIQAKFDNLTRALILDGAPVYAKDLFHFTSIEGRKFFAKDTYRGIPSLMMATGVSPLAIAPILDSLTTKTLAFKPNNAPNQAFIRYNRMMLAELMRFNPSATHPPYIVLNQDDYETLKRRSLLAPNIITIVVFHDDQLIMAYQKSGFDQSINVTTEMPRPKYSRMVKTFITQAHSKFQDFITDEVLSETTDYVMKTRKKLKKIIDSTPLNIEAFLQDETRIINKLKSTYGDRPIPLYDESIEHILRRAKAAHLYELRRHIYSNIQLLSHPKNLKPLLFYSTFFIKKKLTDHIIAQAFTNRVTFYQIIKTTGIPLNESRAYPNESIQSQAMGQLILVKHNKMNIDNHHAEINPLNDSSSISEFDILKGIKSYYLYVITKSMNDPSWASTRTAIRDTLILGQSTLFLNVIRTNRDLTKIKDTKSYLTLCNLMRGTPVSDEAKNTLMSRVLGHGANPTPRDVTMALALACDFDHDKATFIKLCRDYLLAENPHNEERQALNAALQLLSKDEHNTLRNRLIAISKDPSLLPTLKIRLNLKNCAFIDIIRTSEDERSLKDTGTFTTWANTIKSASSRRFNVFSLTAYDPNRHSANICSTNPSDEEAGLSFAEDRPKRR